MESYKTMETMEEALDKLGCRQNFGQGPVEPVEPVQPHALLDVASLALYGCHALPVRLKILLDRLFSVLRPDQVVQVLRGFGWTQDDYARGYILNEANGASLDRFNICSPEEEPLVLQQFLRFGETRALTELLMRNAGGATSKPGHEAQPQERVERPAPHAPHAPHVPLASHAQPPREERAELRQQTPLHSPQQRERDVPSQQPSSLPTPGCRQSPGPRDPPRDHRERERDRERENRDDDKRMPHALNFSLSSARQSQPSSPVSPQQKHPPPPSQQSPQGPLSFLNRSQPQPQSPPGGSPLNRLQNMQPFDFRKMAASAVRASPEPPGLLNLRPPPPPPPPVPTSTMNSLSLPPHFSHAGLGTVPLTAANLVASSFPGLISSAMAGSKSPSTDLTSRTGSSDFGSEEDDEDDSSGSALNLSRDRNEEKLRAKRPIGSPPAQQRSVKHPPPSFSPLKRQSGWPSSSSQLPVNLGTQLINPATGKKRVQCNVCLKTFCDKGALKIHFSAVHLREMHRCTVEGCSMMFSSRRSRNRHSANPNPKLHSPHLRRKISPHDGRSAQSHPILLPPQVGGLNPLNFGAFPLLTPPPDPRNAMQLQGAPGGPPSALDLNLKNSLGLSLRYEREHRERERERCSRERDRDGGVNLTSLSMDEDDDDDEEGIVVVGGADDDDDVPEDLQAKRPKLSVSDGDDNSNLDMDGDDDSQSALDLGSTQENGVDHGQQSARSGRKRKSQNPTRCTQPASLDDMSNFDDSSSDNNMYPNENPEGGLDLKVRRPTRDDHHDTEERQAREQDSVQPPHEENNSQDDQVFRLTKEQKEDSIEPPTENRMEATAERVSSETAYAECEETNAVINEADPNEQPSSPCAGSPPSSPAGSHSSSMGSHDEDGFYFPDGYFANMDVPIDKDNPRRCTACGKVFQNHFGVKTHFQNVHLKLMHKCTVDGCNAAFPSKRSRDRHSANLNLHRKLLSTSSGDKPPSLFLPGAMHPDVLARLYSDPSGRPLGPDGAHVLMPPLGYPLGFASHHLNGRADSASPTSPRSLDEDIGRPPKLDLLLGARSRSDPGGLAAHADALLPQQRRSSVSSDS